MSEEFDPYVQLQQLFYDCYGCVKRPYERPSKIPKIFADYVWDPDLHKRSREHVIGSLNEVIFGVTLETLLSANALFGQEQGLHLSASNIHDDACGVDYFLSLPTGELIGGLDVKCSPCSRIKAPNSISSAKSYNRRALEGIFWIVEVGATPHDLGVFDYMQLLRDFMTEGYDLSPVTPENFIRGELSNGRRKAALGGIKQTLGYYVDNFNLPYSFRNGLEYLYNTVDWHIKNTGNVDYGGLY